MDDLVLRYIAQFATVTVACLALAEWGTPNWLRTHSPRPKMWMALAYALALNSAGWFAGLIVLPEVAVSPAQQFAGVLVLSVVSMATASGVVAIKHRLMPDK